MTGKVAVCFSSRTFDSSCAQEGSIGPSQSFTCGPKVAKETLVSGPCTFDPRLPLAIPEESNSPLPSGGPNLASETRDAATVGVAFAQSLPKVLDEAVLWMLNSSKAPSTWSNY